MTTETESSALIIQKIKKQKDEIIHQISEIKCPENLQQIEIWIKQIDLEPPTIHISLLAIAIDTIFFYFKNEINKESKRLIESSLCYLINKLSKQPNADEILEIVPILKAYIKTNDNEHKCKLEKITRKKIKPRIINFDENGKGYVVNEIRVIKKIVHVGKKVYQKINYIFHMKMNLNLLKIYVKHVFL